MEGAVDHLAGQLPYVLQFPAQLRSHNGREPVVMTKPKGKGRDIRYHVWKPVSGLFVLNSSHTSGVVERMQFEATTPRVPPAFKQYHTTGPTEQYLLPHDAQWARLPRCLILPRAHLRLYNSE